jgi:hypothetical protein
MTTLRFALLALIPFFLAAACATGGNIASVGAGGGGASGTPGAGGAAGPGGAGGGGGEGAKDGGNDAPPDVAPDGPIPCVEPSQCAGLKDACNNGTCTNGFCVQMPANDGASCDDGLYCTENDTCQAGTCVGGTMRNCPTMGFCDMGVCDEASKSCKDMPANDGSMCPGSDICTQYGVCLSGMCTKGPPVDCSFLDSPCGMGTCDPVKGCVATPLNNGSMCVPAGGNQCQTMGTCMAGTCVPTPMDGAMCDDMLGSNCSQGICMGGACVSMPQNDGQMCNNGLLQACQVGVCMAGTCTAQPAMEGAMCDDMMFNPCTQGYCHGGNCVSEPLANGSACDDMNFCTIADKCTAGVCNGDPNPCTPMDPCQVGICSMQAQACLSAPGNDGSPCTGGNPCLVGGTCSVGMCTGGVPGNNGMACNDGNACDVGATCSAGACGNPVSQITMCINGDGCCPPGCNFNNDNDCIYWQPGVQENVDVSALVGWTQCYLGTYGDFESPPIPMVLQQQCTGSKLLMACRMAGSTTLAVLAMAPRADVTFECGMAVNCTKQSNGVGWYFDNNSSWGFAPGGQPVDRQFGTCDDTIAQGDQRLCWTTTFNTLDSGVRCGANQALFDFTYERLIFEAN